MLDVLDKKHIAGLDLLSNIESIETEMLDMEQADCPVRHHFGPGIYMREVSIKAGVFAIGHYQRTEHLNIFTRGKVEVVKDDGTTEILSAPMVFTSKPGRKIGLVLEDMSWFNVYSTEERDIEKLEDVFLDKSEACKNHEHKDRLLVEIDNDYQEMLEELGVTEEIVRSQSELVDDQIPFPNISLSVQVSKSPIEGKGLFATCDFTTGDIIAPSRVGDFRTPAGRYTNHSKHPNSKMILVEGNIFLEAITNIKGCTGGNLGDEISVDYRQSAELIRSMICQE